MNKYSNNNFFLIEEIKNDIITPTEKKNETKNLKINKTE